MLCSVSLECTKHRHRSTCINHVCFKSILLYRIDDIALCADTAVLCGYKGSCLLLKLIEQEGILIAIAHDYVHIAYCTFYCCLSRIFFFTRCLHYACIYILRKLQHRRHSDSSADKEGFLTRLYCKAVSKRSQKPYLIAHDKL